MANQAVPDQDVDVFVAVPRYTTLAAVKRRLEVDDQWDDEITAAIVAVEIAIDKFCGAAWDVTDPNLAPIDIQETAKRGALALFAAMDAPLGVAGSDDYLGEMTTLDATEIVRREVNRNPALRGYRVEFGIGG